MRGNLKLSPTSPYALEISKPFIRPFIHSLSHTINIILQQIHRNHQRRANIPHKRENMMTTRKRLCPKPYYRCAELFDAFFGWNTAVEWNCEVCFVEDASDHLEEVAFVGG